MYILYTYIYIYHICICIQMYIRVCYIHMMICAGMHHINELSPCSTLPLYIHRYIHIYSVHITVRPLFAQKTSFHCSWYDDLVQAYTQMYACIYIYIHMRIYNVYMYIHIYIYTYRYIHMHTQRVCTADKNHKAVVAGDMYKHMHHHLHTYIQTHIHRGICMNTCIYIVIHTYIYVYIHTYI